MTLSAWRTLKDAPVEGTILAKLADGQLKLATATVVTVGFCRHGGDPGWQEAAWVDEDDRQIPDDSIVGWLPIADTLELDRAVQVKVVEAFGVLLQAIVDAHSCVESLDDPHVILGAKLRKELRWAAVSGPRRAIEKFSTILHSAMGGRIPDEVP